MRIISAIAGITCFLIGPGLAYCQNATARVGESVQFQIYIGQCTYPNCPFPNTQTRSEEFSANGPYVTFTPNQIGMRYDTVDIYGYDYKCRQYLCGGELVSGLCIADSAVRMKPSGFTASFHVDSATKNYLPVSEFVRFYNTVEDSTTFSLVSASFNDSITTTVNHLRLGVPVSEVTMQPNTFVDTSVLLFTTAHVPTVRNIITGHITFHAKNYSLDTTYQSYVYLVFDPLVEDTILSVWQNTPAPYHLRSYYSLLAGKVTIELALEENAVVSMIVSDILGKTVAIPVNGPVWAGLTTYDLDLPSGVYFVRTEISGNVRTEKIVVP